MEISREGVRFSWDFYRSLSRTDVTYDLAKGWLRQPQTIRKAARIDRNHREIGERRGSVIKYELDCYTMANSTNVMYSNVCWFECYTHFHQQMSHFLNERMSEKSDLAEKEAGGWIFGPTFILPDNLCTAHRTPYIISMIQAYPVRPALEL